VVTFGIYDTLFSGLIAIFGWEMLLLAAGTDVRRFGEMAGRYARWIAPYFEAAADVNAPAFMCHDDICWTSGPVLAPAWYREFVFPHYRRLWQPVLESGKRLLFTSDGNYTMFFDDIVSAGAHVLVMEPSCDMAGFAARYGKTHGFIGNADTRILLTGSRRQIRDEVQRCMEIGRHCPGFIMAVGNHIPANTPVDSALYYNECYMKLRKR
jgi:uroporphyrinogen-III decarboxylase